MTIKDYYTILEVSRSATPLVIKKAYRRLALKYHPDRNGGSSLYEQKFKDVNEAYRVLSNETKRNDYNYAKWGRHHTDQKKAYTPMSVPLLLAIASKLKHKVANSDPHRLNDKLLSREVSELLSRSNVMMLIEKGQDKERFEIITNVIFVCHYVPYLQAQSFISSLVHLAHTNNDILLLIKKFDNELKYRSLWNRYKILIVMFMVAVLCLFIYFID